MAVVICRPGGQPGRLAARCAVGVNGVIGEEGAFMILPPQLLHVEPPDGL